MFLFPFPVKILRTPSTDGCPKSNVTRISFIDIENNSSILDFCGEPLVATMPFHPEPSEIGHLKFRKKCHYSHFRHTSYVNIPLTLACLQLLFDPVLAIKKGSTVLISTQHLFPCFFKGLRRLQILFCDLKLTGQPEKMNAIGDIS